jgi:hypothetical protein
MKSLFVAAATLALAGTAAAEQRAHVAAVAPAYAIEEANARLPFSSTAVRGYRVGEDGALLIEGNRNRWYRAELNAGCRSDLRWAFHIGLRPGGGSDTLDRFSSAVIDGRRCQFQTFDRIADPDTEAPAQEG